MKLNPDLIRKILLNLEENITVDDDMITRPVSLSDLHAFLPKYSLGEISYTVDRMEEAGFVKILYSELDITQINHGICAITYSGHEFLETVRSNEVWRKTQSVLGNVGSSALWFVLETAKSVLSSGVVSLLNNPII